ncbi:MAG: heme biosynthesis HemY N-terminal domain-containing protein [Candidatus Accumulibacter delftensis]
MRGLLWLLALAAMAVGVSLTARVNDGYLLLIVPPYRIEVALSLAIILFFLAFVLLFLVLRTIGLTLSLPSRFGGYRARRRREKATASLHEAIRLLFEGRFTQALKKAGEAHTLPGRIRAWQRCWQRERRMVCANPRKSRSGSVALTTRDLTLHG